MRYFAPDGESILESVGKTRNVSRGGMAIIAKASLKRRAELHLQVHSSDGRRSVLTGEVRFLQNLDGETFLIGVRFKPLDDDRLAPAKEAESHAS